jgi:lipopolysaccharide export system permease protein
MTPLLRVNLLDRHIFKSVLFTSLGAVALFVFILLLGNAIKDLLGLVLAGQLPLSTFAQLVLLLVPYAIMYALPVGILTGVLLTLGRLSADSEITAMRAAGLSLFRIARPVFILGLVGAGAGLYINFESMPWARVEYQRQKNAAVRADPLSMIIPKTFITQFPGVVIYVGEKQGTLLRDFWVWKLDSERRVQQLVRADSGTFEYDADSHELVLNLVHAQAEQRDEKSPEGFAESQQFASFDRYGPERLSLDRIFGRNTAERKRVSWMSYAQLQAELARLTAQRVPREQAAEHERAQMKVRFTIQEKFNTALAVLSFALIAVPLGIKVSRRETSANLGLAVVLALSYHLLGVMVGWLDRHPQYRPDLLLWLPNFMFVGIAIWLFARIERRS